MFRLLTSFCRSGNLGEVSVENDPQQEHFIYEEGKENENFEAVRVIFGVCWISLVIEHYLPFSFPASVIGMVLLLICLLTGFLKIEHVQEKADFLLSNMAFFFVPAGVSIINYFDELKSTAVQLILICIISTVVTFAVTAYSVMFTVHLMKKWKDRREKA